MIDNILSSLYQAINSCLSWLLNVWESSGDVITLFTSLFLIFTFVRLVLRPLLGSSVRSGSSDRVKNDDKVKQK